MTVKTVSVAECRRLMERGQPLNIVDVRTPGEFTRVHASGARMMPLDELDPVALAAGRRDANDPIYLICQSGKRSVTACRRLQEAGVDDVHSIEGGTVAWEQMGLPVERGATGVISLERQVRIGAGALVLLGLILAWTVHPAFLAIPAFIGAGLVFAGITDYCGMAMILARMPWNRRGPAKAANCPA